MACRFSSEYHLNSLLAGWVSYCSLVKAQRSDTPREDSLSSKGHSYLNSFSPGSISLSLQILTPIDLSPIVPSSHESANEVGGL